MAKLGSGDIALGVMPDVRYQEHRVTLAPGDALVLYTDGVTDAMNAAGEHFDRTRLIGVAARTRHEGATAMVRHIIQAVQEFGAGTTPFDDLTLVVVSRSLAQIDNSRYI